MKTSLLPQMPSKASYEHRSLFDKVSFAVVGLCMATFVGVMSYGLFLGFKMSLHLN